MAGLANTLSVLLNFKSDISGLEKFTGVLTSRLQKVQELNKKITNGAAAVNSALQAAAGFFAISQLKAYTQEATGARIAQGKLAQALKQQKQDSPAYRAELDAQASALQGLTGYQDEQVAGVQRQLVFAGAQRKDIAELTALTLDFAAAKEVDAVSAAKAVSRALQGEGDELQRYGVEVTLAGDKIADLKAGLGKFKGQAATAFAALPEGMRNFAVASKAAKQSAGEAIIALTSPFLQGVASGLEQVKARLDEIKSGGSAVRDMLVGVSTALGTFVGANLDKILLLAGGFLALKGGAYALNQALSVLASGFLLLTNQALIPTIAQFFALQRGIGLVRVLAVASWPTRLAAGLALVGGALTALAAGAVAIQAIQSISLARIETENQVAQKMADQTKELTEQLRLIKSIEDAKNATSAIETALTDAVTKRDALEAKAKKIVRVDAKTGRITRAGLNASDTEQMAMLNQQIFDLSQRDRLGRDKKWVESQINKNNAADDPTTKPLTKEQRAARDELDLKRQLFDLETSIKEAEADHNDALVDRLTHERDELALLQQLGAEAFELVKARLAIEEELRKKQRDGEESQRQEFRLETEALAAEATGNSKLAEQLREQAKAKALAREDDRRSRDEIEKRLAAESALADRVHGRQQQEQAFSRRIAENDMARQLIDQDYYLTDEEKNLAKIRLLQESNRLIKERIALLEHEQTLSPDPTRQQTIDSLRQQRGDNSAEILQLTPLTPQQGFLAGVVDFLSQIPTLAERARSSIVSIGSALQGGLASSIEGLIKRTMTWRDALLNVATSVVNTLISSFANMVADWIVRQVTMMVFGKALAAAQLAAMVPIATAAAAIWSVPATLATIATMGAAAVAAPMAIAAANMSTTAMSMIPGLATGGVVRGVGTGTSDSNLRRLSDGEGVLNAAATSFVGEDFVHALNSGARDLDALSGSIAGTLPAAAADYGGSGGGGGGFDAAGMIDAIAKKISLQAIVVPDERAAKRIERRSQAADDVVAIVRSRRSEIFRQGA